MAMKNCKRCIWYDDCAEQVPCEHYYDGSLDSEIEDYGLDLKIRAKAYAEVVENVLS